MENPCCSCKLTEPWPYSCNPYGESLLQLYADTCPAAVQRVTDILMTASLGPFSWSFIQFLLSDLAFLAIARALLSAIDCSTSQRKSLLQRHCFACRGLSRETAVFCKDAVAIAVRLPGTESLILLDGAAVFTCIHSTACALRLHRRECCGGLTEPQWQWSL